MPDIWWYQKRKCWCADVPDIEESGKRRRVYLGKEEDEARRKLHQYLADFYGNRPSDRGQKETLSLYSLAARFFRLFNPEVSYALIGTVFQFEFAEFGIGQNFGDFHQS